MRPDLEQEIADHRAQAGGDTRRAVVPALEEILYLPQPVLDQGFARVIDYMGDDAAIVQAARVSYGKGTKAVSNDRGLINYLMRNRHTSPMEMAEIKLHLRMPIFIARQWLRHRTANVNEMSGRYSEMPAEFYLPDEVHCQSDDNRQGSEGIHYCSEDAKSLWKERNQDTFDVYHNDLDADISREEARINLPLSTYTELYWKIDLHNLLHFCSLRADSHAQYEIRAYADVLLDIVKRWVPLTYEAFIEHRKEAVTFSKSAMTVVRACMKGEPATRPDGMSDREWREVLTVLDL